ncbi:uncharacterized protein MELLADRAFT_69189 [Melampsora larici-populina 98AG31]|uniref:Uncharacterized protein n=1 Tax=Melampsora larici-populina (strain 98AG31 / pathotype 3-4-7) TaxID=747676 RepID=F4S9Q3_MELLP|nr:uncharacterized protein MELLADRAFT_69189 [Melampsora larici-populina 98AG31]EGF98615.1 hypothetical protein MELLADRAFT_69189 [Melampsora larici-populina 98AG31]
MTSTNKSTRNSKSSTNSRGTVDNNVQPGSTSHDAGESGMVESMLTSGPNTSSSNQQQQADSVTSQNLSGANTQTQSQSAGTKDSESQPSQPSHITGISTNQGSSGDTAPGTIAHDLTATTAGETTTSKSPRKTITSATTQTTNQSKSNTADKRGNKDPSLDQGYLSLLSNNPADQILGKDTQPSLNWPSSGKETSADATQQHKQTLPDIDLSDEKAVWKRALELASTGRIDEATMYFRLHTQLQSQTEKSPSATFPRRTPSQSTDTPATTKNLSTSAKVVVEGGLSFISGAITSHTDIGFTPYFDRNLKELRGPIPLTIFNKHWQELANSYHVEKRVKTDNLNKDLTTYTGYPYPHEMTQSYATWNVNYRNFVAVLRDVYKFKTFANWAEAHQANVEFYHERDNWMTAFRYDIKIRLNAFAFRVTENGTTVPPDISQRREDIAAICFAETRRLDEGAFTDNPYAKGGARFGYDWTTGLPRSNNNNSQHHSLIGNATETHHPQQSSSHHNSHPYGNYGGNNKRHHSKQENNGGGGRIRGGYNGKNFDPNYAAKKAANARPTQQGNST